MKLKNFIPLASTLLCFLGSPVQSHPDDMVDVVINGVCDVMSNSNRYRTKCIVIDFGDGGYVTNIEDKQVYINESTNKMYINGAECLIPKIKSNSAAVSSICASSPDFYTLVMPIRSQLGGVKL